MKDLQPEPATPPGEMPPDPVPIARFVADQIDAGFGPETTWVDPAVALRAAADEIEALRAVARLFLIDNAEHINYARTVHDELKVWINGEKNYLSPSAADAATRAVERTA